MTGLEEQINAAFEKAFNVYPWLNESEQLQIRAEFGQDALDGVNEILKFAQSHTNIWTRHSDLAQSSALVASLVAAAYPKLSPQALRKVVNVAAYNWR